MNNKAWAKIMLFAATIIWGISFLVVKNAVDVITPMFIIAFRFLGAFAVLCIVFWTKLKMIDRSYLISGTVVGIALFAAYCAQTFGITDTTPGKNAFLTATYCVMVPFLVWIVKKKRPDIYSFSAAFMCICGIGLVALKGDYTVSYGDGLTILCGFMFAVHMMCVTHFGSDKDPILLSILQFGVAGAIGLVAGLIFEPLPTAGIITTEILLNLGFLALFPTAIALTFQIVGQKYTEPMAASLILSLEAVFGIAFSLAVGQDVLTPRLGFGFLLIFVSLIISETKLSFLKRKN